MSDFLPSKVVMFDNDDPAMRRACEAARGTFRFFWRELAWENRRIVPALDMAMVKAPFVDPPGRGTEGGPPVEQMWVSEIDFDGLAVTGVLVNSPNWLTSVEEGDPASFPLGQVSDWMYAIEGEVYGAHTVQLLRSRMTPRERAEHDAAWDLDFGDPAKVRLAPDEAGWFGEGGVTTAEHPMSLNMVASLKQQLAKNRALVSAKGDKGWTLLHQEALAGSAPTVKVLLDAGADPRAVTDHGLTALQLAQSLGWDNVVALLAPR